MAKKLKIYLDTSVISFLFADDAPDKREATIRFFEDFIRPEAYETYISRYVIGEIENDPNKENMDRMLQVLRDYPVSFLQLDNLSEIDELALKYVKAGVIPEKKIADAYHIAVSVTNQINFLVSWNYKHLANINRERRINVGPITTLMN